MKLTIGQLKELVNKYSDQTEVTFEFDHEDGGVLDFKEVNDAFAKEKDEEDDDFRDWKDFPSILTILLHNLQK